MNKDHKFLVHVLSGPALFALTYFACINYCDAKQAGALATCMWMGIWWVLRPVDIAVTALLPILLNSFLGMVPMNGIISRYFSEIVILLLGSDLISITWESSKLDQRLALRSLCLIGASLKQQIFVWLTASTVLSIFLPNVVTVQILIPVAIA
ncbi:MAG: anion permease, partial [Phascolarctobacterium sp.]|nr:anion permease [Phascolarctobacterium sp.]